MESMEVYNQVSDDVECVTIGCPNSASRWVTDFKKAIPVCEDCKDELTSDPQRYRELRVV